MARLEQGDHERALPDQHAPVLRHRLGHVAAPQGPHDRGRALALHLDRARHLREEVADDQPARRAQHHPDARRAAGLDHGVVELHGGGEELVGVVDGPEALHDRGQPIDQLVARAGHRSFEREAVDEAVELVAVAHRIGVERVDVGPTVGLDRDPPVLLQRDEALADRDATELELGRHEVLRHPVAGAEVPVEDELPQVVGHLLTAAAPFAGRGARGREAAGRPVGVGHPAGDSAIHRRATAA